jgi:AcrR family transcriptional regulator
MNDVAVQAQVVEAADRLFYERGLRAVGMDSIRDASGVSLKKLYRLFPAKDRLVEAVLQRRDLELRAALARHVEPIQDPEEKILAVFDFLHAWFREDDYRGCLFVNSFGEAGATTGPVAAAVRDQKDAFKEFIGSLVAQAGGERLLVDQLFILAHGAMVASAILGDPAAALHAKDAARVLLAAAPLRSMPLG